VGSITPQNIRFQELDRTWVIFIPPHKLRSLATDAAATRKCLQNWLDLLIAEVRMNTSGVDSPRGMETSHHIDVCDAGYARAFVADTFNSRNECDQIDAVASAEDDL
jgi:hypothetical protein